MPLGSFCVTNVIFALVLFSRVFSRSDDCGSMMIMSFMPDFWMLSMVYSIMGRPMRWNEDLWLSVDNGQKRLDFPAQSITACMVIILLGSFM